MSCLWIDFPPEKGHVILSEPIQEVLADLKRKCSIKYVMHCSKRKCSIKYVTHYTLHCNALGFTFYLPEIDVVE